MLNDRFFIIKEKRGGETVVRKISDNGFKASFGSFMKVGVTSI